MLNIPEKFQADINGNDFSIYPIVIIGEGSSAIRISINSITFHGEYYSPILLNLPSLKETIDIDKRNYRIPSLNLNISNAIVNDKRFSERVQGSLIGAKVNVRWVSPSCEVIDDAFSVYTGHVNKYTHSLEKAQVVIEDSTQQAFHREVPIENIGDSDAIAEKDRNKPIPMVYGFIDHSPCVVVNDEIFWDRLWHKWGVSNLKVVQNDFYLDVVNDYRVDDFQYYSDLELPETDDEDSVQPIAAGLPQIIWEQELDGSDDPLAPSKARLANSFLVRLGILQTEYTGKPRDIKILKHDCPLCGTYNVPPSENEWVNPVTPEDIDKITYNELNSGGDWDENAYHSGTLVGEYIADPGTYMPSFYAQGGNCSNCDYYHPGGFPTYVLEIGKGIDVNVEEERISILRVDGKGLINQNHSTHEQITNSPWWGILIVPYDFVGESDPELKSCFNGHGVQTFFEYGSSSSWVTCPTYYAREFAHIGTLDWEDLFHFPAHRVNPGFCGQNWNDGGSHDVPEYSGNPHGAEGSGLSHEQTHLVSASYEIVNFEGLNGNETYIGPSNQSFGIRLRTTVNDDGSSVVQIAPWFNSFGMHNNVFDSPGQPYDLHIKVNVNYNFRDMRFGSYMDIKNKGPYYVRTTGRDTSYLTEQGASSHIYQEDKARLPFIVRHIMTEELSLENELLGESFSETAMVDRDELGINYAFATTSRTSSKKVIEQLCSVSPFFPKFDSDGKFQIRAIKKYYLNPVPSKYMVDANTVIDFKFERTKIEQVYQGISFHYQWDYHNKNFLKKINVKLNSVSWDEADETLFYLDDLAGLEIPAFYTYDSSFYGIDSASPQILTIDDDRGKYIRTEEDARKIANWLLSWHANQHLKITFNLTIRDGLKYETGDVIGFNKRLGDINPYNIGNEGGTNYAGSVNGQTVFNHFIIISTNKKIDKVEIVAMQLHNLFIGEDDKFIDVRCSDSALDENGNINACNGLPEGGLGYFYNDGSCVYQRACCDGSVQCPDECEALLGTEACEYDCNGIPGGMAEFDCFNDCGGTAVVDECGVCGGNGPTFECCDGKPVCSLDECDYECGCLEGSEFYEYGINNDIDECPENEDGTQPQECCLDPDVATDETALQHMLAELSAVIPDVTEESIIASEQSISNAGTYVGPSGEDIDNGIEHKTWDWPNSVSKGRFLLNPKWSIYPWTKYDYNMAKTRAIYFAQYDGEDLLNPPWINEFRACYSAHIDNPDVYPIPRILGLNPQDYDDYVERLTSNNSFCGITTWGLQSEGQVFGKTLHFYPVESEENDFREITNSGGIYHPPDGRLEWEKTDKRRPDGGQIIARLFDVPVNDEGLPLVRLAGEDNVLQEDWTPDGTDANKGGGAWVYPPQSSGNDDYGFYQSTFGINTSSDSYWKDYDNGPLLEVCNTPSVNAFPLTFRMLVEIRTLYSSNMGHQLIPMFYEINFTIEGEGYGETTDWGESGGGFGGGGYGGIYDESIKYPPDKESPHTRAGDNCHRVGDINRDGSFSIMDIVALSHCIHRGDCNNSLPMPCAGDVTGDGGFNIFDLLALANCITENNCGG